MCNAYLILEIKLSGCDLKLLRSNNALRICLLQSGPVRLLGNHKVCICDRRTMNTRKT